MKLNSRKWKIRLKYIVFALNILYFFAFRILWKIYYHLSRDIRESLEFETVTCKLVNSCKIVEKVRVWDYNSSVMRLQI